MKSVTKYINNSVDRLINNGEVAKLWKQDTTLQVQAIKSHSDSEWLTVQGIPAFAAIEATYRIKPDEGEIHWELADYPCEPRYYVPNNSTKSRLSVEFTTETIKVLSYQQHYSLREFAKRFKLLEPSGELTPLYKTS